MKLRSLSIGERKLLFESGDPAKVQGAMRIVGEGQVGYNVKLHVEFSRLDALKQVSWFTELVIEATDTSTQARVIRRLVEGVFKP